MRDLFRPLAMYAAPSILTVGFLYFVLFLCCMFGFPSEFVSLPFVEHNISTVIWILEF
jgi:hypothetical protein